MCLNVGHMFAAGTFTALQGTLTFGMGAILKPSKTDMLSERLTKAYLAKAMAGQVGYIIDILGSFAISDVPSKYDYFFKYIGLWAS